MTSLLLQQVRGQRRGERSDVASARSAWVRRVRCGRRRVHSVLLASAVGARAFAASVVEGKSLARRSCHPSARRRVQRAVRRAGRPREQPAGTLRRGGGAARRHGADRRGRSGQAPVRRLRRRAHGVDPPGADRQAVVHRRLCAAQSGDAAAPGFARRGRCRPARSAMVPAHRSRRAGGGRRGVRAGSLACGRRPREGVEQDLALAASDRGAADGPGRLRRRRQHLPRGGALPARYRSDGARGVDLPRGVRLDVGRPGRRDARGSGGGRIDTVDDVHSPEAQGRAPRVDRHGGEVYAYRRLGQPCLVCGTPIAGAELAGRNLYWCPTCQPAGSPGQPR